VLLILTKSLPAESGLRPMHVAQAFADEDPAAVFAAAIRAGGPGDYHVQSYRPEFHFTVEGEFTPAAAAAVRTQLERITVAADVVRDKLVELDARDASAD
jgi:hypothetical protein